MIIMNIAEPEVYVDCALVSDPKTFHKCFRLIREVIGEPYPGIFEVEIITGKRVYVKNAEGFKWVEVTDQYE